MQICGLVLAAGLSSRMGVFKPLLPLGERTVIEATVDSILSGGGARVAVVTGYRGDEVTQLLRARYGERVLPVENPAFARTDMLTSVHIGCRALLGCGAFFLLPGDMPFVRRETFQALLAARPEGVSIGFPTLEGVRKHPPLVDGALIPEILAFREEGGLRRFWQQHEDLIYTVPVADDGVEIDLDTPEDYQRHQDRKNRRHR